MALGGVRRAPIVAAGAHPLHHPPRFCGAMVASASVGDPFIEANAMERRPASPGSFSASNVIDALIKPMVYLLAPRRRGARRVHDVVPYLGDRAVRRCS